MEQISKILEFAAKYAWAIWVTAVFVLFIPPDALKQLGLEEIKKNNLGYFWLILFFTSTLSFGSLLSYIDKKVFDGWLVNRRERKEKERAKLDRLIQLDTRLNSLDARERTWISYCLYHNVQTLSAQMDNTTAQSLLYKGILSQGSGSMLNLPFHIPDYVWEHLKLRERDFVDEASVNNPKYKAMLDEFRNSLYPDY